MTPRRAWQALRDRLADLLTWPRPDVAQARRQQQRVTGGGSLRVDVAAAVRAAKDEQWRCAAICAEAGRVDLAAFWAIAASGCDPVHTVEGE